MTSLQLAFSWLFRLIALYFSCNYSLVLEVMSVASTYSAAILDPQILVKVKLIYSSL